MEAPYEKWTSRGKISTIQPINQNFGVLSTISEEFDRYPFGSLTPYSLNHLGEPVIPIAEIAQQL